MLVAVLLLAMVLVVVVVGSVEADYVPPLLVEYPVPGSPHDIVVEAPGRVWFTLPDQNLVGRLTVSSTVGYEMVTYIVPTASSEPYDLGYADGAIWFTERMGNSIGRLDTTTGEMNEFYIPTSGSRPAGIDVVSGAPTRVWFTEQAANKLGQLVITSTTEYIFIEYPLPTNKFPGDPQPQDLYVENQDSIWFTAPGANRIGNLKLSYWPWQGAFRQVPTDGESQPWAIEVSADGYPWFTDAMTNRIGQYFPQTLSLINWYLIPAACSGPYDIVTSQGMIWFTERDGHRVGQLDPKTRVFREFGLPDSQPLGLAVDENGYVWVAESATGKVAEWRPPYFRFVYLPLALKNG